MRRFLRLKAVVLFVVSLLATLIVLPSLVPNPDENLPSWITSVFPNRFKLGLDLQGGLHLEYSVAVDEAIEQNLDQIAGELESKFREKKNVDVKITRRGIDSLVLEFETPDQLSLATDDVMGITFGILERVDSDPGPDSSRTITLQMPQSVIADNRAAAVANSLETVRKRVDAMGVAEPSIYPKNRQIVVELPGKSDAEAEARAAASEASAAVKDALIRNGAEHVIVDLLPERMWDFRVTVPEGDARALLRTTFAQTMSEDGVIFDPQLPAELQVVTTDGGESQEDPSSVVLTPSESARESILAEQGDFRRLLRVIERQAVLTMHLVDDETLFRDTRKPYLRALYESGLVRQGMGISVNLESDYGREGGVTVREPVAFYAKDFDTLDRFFKNLPIEWRPPPELKVAFGPTPIQTRRGSSSGGGVETVYRTYVIKSRASVSGRHIVSASVGFSQDDGGAEVDVKLDSEGARLFEVMSGENVGRKMAIVLDDQVRSDPIFNEPIPGGNVRIALGATPNQSQTEAANDLVKVLKSGSLPARLQKELELKVGADLGEEAVRSGFLAFVLGLLAVVIFMIVYYRMSGFIAVIAIVLNMLYILAAMALFQATLTLPGIAGIVLTIGMAVDANVIIYERIRDYLREGYSARAAVESGYDRAFTTIVDAQLTTAIAGLVLYQYGSGPIQGFAVTLLIGIATSIVTGVSCTRLFFDVQANRRGFDRVSI